METNVSAIATENASGSQYKMRVHEVSSIKLMKNAATLQSPEKNLSV